MNNLQENIREASNKGEGRFLHEIMWSQINWDGIKIPPSFDENDIDAIARDCIARKKTSKADIEKFIEIYVAAKKSAESAK